MVKLDRLVWAAGLAFESYGVRVGVRVSDAGVLEILSAHFPPGWKPLDAHVVDRLYSVVATLTTEEPARRRGVRRLNLLYADTSQIERTHDFDDLLDIFESDLQLYVAVSARRRVFVHAGVVGWRGRAVIVPGRSFTGKTTLIAELVRAGATYYSDEYAVLDARGRVHPYARPLGVRAGETGGRQSKLAVEALGGRRGEKPLRPGLVVLSEYRMGARWRPRTITAGRGLLALVANTVAVRSRPKAALAALEQVASGSRIVRGARGEAAEVAASILEMVPAA